MKKLILAAALFALTACNCNNNQPQLLDKEAFTTTVDGKDVSLYTIKGGDLIMQVTNYGARVVSLWVPGRDGAYADVEIGYENIDRYINNTGERYLGAVVGPFANRIAKGHFVLDGKEYNTPINNNGQTLHGGILGVDRVVWDVKEVTENKIVFFVQLPDGQDGFPGNREIEMVYELTPNNEFAVSYKGTTDAPTIMNLSHHSFFNLEGDGEGTILDHVLQIDADAITPYDEGAIPTGEIMPVEGTPFDFREPHAIGERVNEVHPQLTLGMGYDHNWVLNRADDGMEVKVADVYSPKSGRGMEVWTDQVGLQFYGGNFFDGSFNNKFGKPVLYRGSLALETQVFPDAPNHPDFPSSTLRPGEVYTHSCVYKFYAK